MESITVIPPKNMGTKRFVVSFSMLDRNEFAKLNRAWRKSEATNRSDFIRTAICRFVNDLSEEEK